MSTFDTDITTNIEDITKDRIEDTTEDTIEATEDTKQEIKPNTEDKSIFNFELNVLKSEIEKAVNPKTIEESIYLLSNQDILISRMQQGANMFKEKTGRNMTYSELREMYG
jgi:hypothetical protein